MGKVQRISPCLWFDTEAEPAANFYVDIFPNSRITGLARYGEVGREFHGKEPGSVMTVGFDLDGHPFTALNGGPLFRFNEAISFQVLCESQGEVDHYWHRLTEDLAEREQPCGWLKDRYGVSWQVIPRVLVEILHRPMSEAAQRATQVVFRMKKLDVETIRLAYEGG